MIDSVSIYKLGIYGKAYDVPGTRRAYTYKHQPDNHGAWRLGCALRAADMAGGGDYIDYGLGLLKQLELKGYGVYELEEAGAPEERQAPVAYWDVSQSLVHMACQPFNQGEKESMAHCRPLYTAPQPAQVSRIPAGLYAELEALRTLRDATGVYLQGYMRDEIEDEDNCVTVDQHDAACSVKSALDNARALEWKGCDK